MKAFKIKRKSKISDILRACEGIVKSAPVYKMQRIYYNAETQEIIATNAFQLLVYKTTEIKDNLGDVGNGESTCRVSS